MEAETSMARLLRWFNLTLLAALNWAALHDIFECEPDGKTEWSTVLATLLPALVVLIRRVSRAVKE